VWRSLVVVLVAMFLGWTSGCISQAARAVNPPPEGGGTLSCREIMEQCDSACTQPFCLHGCTNQGTPEAQPQHDALLSCGERNGCTDEECMRTNCMGEFETCQGLAAGAESEAPVEPAPAEPAPAAPPQ
jgi:hypothetical protein